MICYTNHQKNHFCSCRNSAWHNPEMWSKRKKIRVLTNYLSCLEEQVDDIKEVLKELEE